MINMSVSLLENFRECGTFEVCFFFSGAVGSLHLVPF